MTRSADAKASAALRCPICLDVAEQPTTLSACGHLFCKPCIKEALHWKRECPVCRTAATHRMMRTALISDSVSDDAPTIGRASLEASSADAHIPEGDGSWSCQQCTGDNKEWASRCVICNARQPVKYVGRKAAPQQRHQFVVPRPAQKGKGKSTGVAPAHKRVRQTDEGTRKDDLSRAVAVAHDQMEFDDCGDEEEALQATEGGDEEEEDDLFEHGASTTAPSTAPVTAPLRVGMLVRARWGASTGPVQNFVHYYPGRIIKVHPDKTVDIGYDDGDRESKVRPCFVQALATQSNPSDAEIAEIAEMQSNPWRDAEIAEMLVAPAPAPELALARPRLHVQAMRKGARPLTADDARAVAAAEGLELVPSTKGSETGFKGVWKSAGKYVAKISRKGMQRALLGTFATPEEAALCYARHIGADRSAAEAAEARVEVPQSLTADEARAAAAAEGLELVPS